MPLPTASAGAGSAGAAEAPGSVQSQPLAPSSGCQGLTHVSCCVMQELARIQLCPACGSGGVCQPPMGAFQGPSRSLCKARLPEPCSPTPAGTATPLPLAPTQGNCCGSCSQGRARSHIPLKSRYARESGSCCPLHPSHRKPENVPRRLFHSTLSGKLLELPKSR